jgi:WD40 repeat protein
MKFSPRGDVVAAAGWVSGKISLYEPGRSAPRVSWQAHRAKLHALAFSPDGRFLVSTSEDGSAKIWDVTTQQQCALLLGHIGQVYPVAFAPDGRTLATGGVEDNLVLLWDVSSLRAGPAP